MKKILISILTASIIAGSAWCNDNVKIYPVPAIFTSKELNKFNPHFRSVLNTKMNEWVTYYQDSVSKNFKNIESEISDTNRFKTFAAFVNIPRVSKNEYNKGMLSDIYLPMTMSINFFNMATSELLYSYPFTYYSVYETTKAKLNDKTYTDNVIAGLYDDTYKKLVDTLTEKASKEFTPFSIDVHIIDRYKDLYLLDKGKTAGISKGDLLMDEDGNQIKVVYSNLKYSAARILLGSRSNKAFVKYSNSSISQLKKPKVLFVNTIMNDKLYNLFSSALGSSANFALLNTDKTFFDMQESFVALNMNFKQSHAYEREMPDYFLKLYMTPPIYVQYPSGNAGINTERYSMIASGVIFDKTGKVLYSKCQTEENEQQVVSDVKFNDEAKVEILAKNILNKLAASFASDVKFKDTEFKILKVKDGNIYVNDKVGLLTKDNTISVYRKIKSDKGKKYTIPTWEYKIVGRDGSVVECVPMEATSDGVTYPTPKDKAIMSLASKGAGEKLFNFCPENMKLENSEVELKFFKNIAFSAIASTSKYPIAVDKNDFAREIDKLNSGYGFKNKLQQPTYDENLKIRPVYRIKQLSEKHRGSLLERRYEVVVGLAAYDGDAILKKEGIKQEVTVSTPKDNADNVLQYELLKVIYPLLQKLAQNLQI